MAIQDGAEPTRVKGAVLEGRAWEEHPSQETGRYGHVGDPHTPMETPASPSHVQVRTPAQPLDKSVYCRQPPPLRPTGQLARTGQASGARRHPPEPGPSREQARGGAAPHGPPAGTWAVAVGDSHPPRGSTLPVIAFIRLLDSKAAVRREGPPRGWAQLPGRSPTGPRQPPRPARLPAAPRTAVRDGGGARGRTPGGPCLRNPLEPQAGRKVDGASGPSVCPAGAQTTGGHGVEALPTYLPTSCQPCCRAPPDTPQDKLQAKSRRGGVRQPHPLMSPRRGGAQVSAHAGPLPTWALIRKLPPGSPRDPGGLPGQAGTGVSPPSIAPRALARSPLPGVRAPPRAAQHPGPGSFCPRGCRGSAGRQPGAWLPLPGPVHLSVCVYVYTCVTCVHMGG